ncbi:MAG: hypothetical protein ACREQ9_24905 [Candidatus Binatia bacterium]
MQEAAKRDRILTTLAVLMAIMAFSNFMKPVGQAMRPESTAGFVFFGTRLNGVANAIVGPLFGLLLAAYSYGVWRMRSWAVPIACAYAAYVVLNLVLFTFSPQGAATPLAFAVAYSAVAIGVSSGGAYYLYSRRAELR